MPKPKTKTKTKNMTKTKTKAKTKAKAKTKTKATTKRTVSKSLGRPPGTTGKVLGGVKTRSVLKRIAQVLLASAEDLTIAEASENLGILMHDLKNLRAKNLPGIQLLLRLVRNGRYSPSALIESGKLKKLPGGFSTSGATQPAITKRIRQLAGTEMASVWAKRTGLSEAHVFILRGSKDVGARTLIAFILGGADADEIFFGTKR